jgi:hypothetical protein
MTLTTIRWGLAAVATVLAQFTLIALSIACVAVYSYGIRTGETPEFYSSFAEASAPWVSLIAGDQSSSLSHARFGIAQGQPQVALQWHRADSTSSSRSPSFSLGRVTAARCCRSR